MHSTTLPVASTVSRPATAAQLSPVAPRTPQHGLVRPADVGEVAFQVLVHDGDLRRVWQDTAVRRGTVVTPALRAEALGSVVPARGAVARRSAAWVHLGGSPPQRAEMVIAPTARRPGPHPYRVAFAAPLGHGDVEVLGGVAVTTVRRTGLDIARSCPTETALPMLRALARIGFDADGAWRALAGLAGHRGVLLAEHTLRALLHLAPPDEAAA